MNINWLESYLYIEKFLSFGFLKILQILDNDKAKYPIKNRIMNEKKKINNKSNFFVFMLRENISNIIKGH